MSDLQILITGDYWHGDFQASLAKIQYPVTMVQPQRVSAVSENQFGLIVVAQARRDQFTQATIDELAAQHPNVPIVNLLGSWCEGETRSGFPLTGVHRVLWHQWQSQFEKFIASLESSGVTHWHQPPTTTLADEARDSTCSSGVLGMSVGISATSRVAFETLRDAIVAIGGKSFWVEQDEARVAADTVICIDANSVTETLIARIEEFRTRFESPSFVVILNFPRKQEIEELARWQIDQVISKPFELQDLLASIVRANAGVSQTESIEQKTNATQVNERREV